MSKCHIHQQALARRWMWLVFIFIISHLSFSASAQVRVEYFFDSDPGFGKATKVGAAVDDDGNLVFDAPTDTLKSGYHLMGVRGYQIKKDTTRYSPTVWHQFLVTRPEDEGRFTRLEYFWDEDPGYGKGTSISFTTIDEVEIDDLDISTKELSVGTHTLFIRAFGGAGWSPVLIQQVLIRRAAEVGKILHLEYFWDEDPGIGQATAIDITPDNEISLDNLQLSTEKLSPGTHVLGIRPYGGAGWGPTVTQQVVVEQGAVDVNYVEYFWDEDPGWGKATPLVVVGGKELNLEDVEFSTADLSVGSHRLGVRARGGSCWGPTIFMETFVNMRAKDAVIRQAEYFWDNDPGFGSGTPINITEGQTISVESLGIPIPSDPDFKPGDHQLFVRYRGLRGWSPTLCSDVRVLSGTPTVAAAEYFWNNDPGFGKGTAINLTPGETINLDDFQIPSASVHGDAVLFIRYRGTTGWSPTVAYPVMVDAEGHYTLNAGVETSMEQRNYQSLTDALDDFADRGVGDDVTLEVKTTNNDYVFDASSTERIAQLTAITTQMKKGNTARHQKTIVFTAAEGSGNSISVTTTAEGLPAVVEFFAQTSWQNVLLTINGTTYDFTPATQRFDESCGSTAVGLSTISSAVNVSWQAQPHEGTVLSGFPTTGTGDLPETTITNSGTELDSLAYAITLSDTEGNELCSYLHYKYVHARVGNQTFSNLLPAEGSSLDPGEVTLKWNAIGDAVGGYRVTVSSRPTNDLEATPVEKVAETDETSYTMTAVTGYTYTWTVTAIGYCDELTSQTMTFIGRLLPDLVVESITLPEAAECGNSITVTATVKNQGEGPTTEGSWTDRLYYVVDSEDFGKAVQLAEMKHTDNLAVGESYEVIFQLKVPYLDGNQLRVFIETDVAKQVMEGNNDNNRLLSATAELEPFMMNDNDLAALRNLYDELDGANWNGTPWNTASELITENNWSGVTFDTEGRVTAINLNKRGLKGTLPVSTVATLSQLKTLNLSGNHIDGITEPLPETLTSVNLSNQDLETSVSLSDVVEHSADLTALLPNITTYNSTSRTFAFDGYFNLTNAHDKVNQSWRMNVVEGLLQQVANPTVVYNEESGHIVRMRVHNGNIWNDMFLSVDYLDGDANLDGERNAIDLQHLINYAVNDTHTKVFFNFKAADLQPDGSANVLDVVRLVNLLLDDNVPTTSSRRWKVQRQVADAEAEARLAWRGQELVLITARPVAALDISLHISAEAEVEWLPDESNWQISRRSGEKTSRAIVYSLNGRTLPEGETVVARISSGSATTGSAMLVDAEARKISVATGTATGISEIGSEDNDVDVYTVDGIKHQGKVNRKGLYIVNGKKKMVK